MKIIECVPNFSEGRDSAVIGRIADEIRDTEGASLLDIDPGKDTNRTVMTFVGEPGPVLEAAFRAFKKAFELIDMSRQRGSHPRNGALDVCPIIPVSDISKTECVALSKELGERVGRELGIPVYLYAESASVPSRIRLPDLRKGEYEALPEKIKDPGFVPDYGPAVFNKRFGAAAVGVRDFMLAYNINLNTKNKKAATEIAMNIRESGRARRDSDGKIIRDPEGKPLKIPGKLKFCQAAGWYIDEYGYAQVTTNLHNFGETGLHTVFEEVSREAGKLGLRVTGSELIGLAPKEALLQAGRYYLEKQGSNTGITEAEIIHNAVLSLGLNDTSPFNPTERVIEYCIAKDKDSLSDMTLKEFVELLGSSSPAPGGGSAAALFSAVSASLVSMVANLTYGRKKYKRRKRLMEDISIKAHQLKSESVELIDKDTEAFNLYMKALKMGKKTDAEKESRSIALEEAGKQAALVPLETLKTAAELIDLACEVVKKGNTNALSDGAVGAEAAAAAAEGAYLNIRINLASLKDKNFIAKTAEESQRIITIIRKTKSRVLAYAHKQI